MSAYRQETPEALTCPRCKQQTLPPLDIAACPEGCGTWVSAFAASEAFRDGETRPNPVTRWWRIREPCPSCGEQMTLRGDDPALLQGCDVHGYWVDADTVEHTGLAREDIGARLARKSEDRAAVEAERERLEALAHERAREREARELDRLRVNQTWEEALERQRLASYYTRIAMSVASGDAGPLIEELIRLDAEVRRLTARIAELERR